MGHQHHFQPGQQPGVFFQLETYLLPRKIFLWNSRPVRTSGNIWRRSGEMFAGQCDAAGSGSCTQEREDHSTLPLNSSCKIYNFLAGANVIFLMTNQSRILQTNLGSILAKK